MSAERFINAAIGKPWAAGAQGPDAYDCWGLARATQRALFGRDLPIAACAADPDAVKRDDLRAVIRAMGDSELKRGWDEVTSGPPADGDIAMLSHRKYPSHIGTYLALDRGGILHVTREGGVRFDPLTLLKLQGWVRVAFYRPAAVALAQVGNPGILPA